MISIYWAVYLIRCWVANLWWEIKWEVCDSFKDRWHRWFMCPRGKHEAIHFDIKEALFTDYDMCMWCGICWDRAGDEQCKDEAGDLQ